jgi:hypothetical protein
MSDSDNVLSDDVKWFIQMFAVFGTFTFVIYRLGIKLSKSDEGIWVNHTRFSNGRMKIRHTDHYNEFELIALDKNAMRARTAMKIIGKGPPYICPWGNDCHFRHPIDNTIDLGPLEYLMNERKVTPPVATAGDPSADAVAKDKALAMMVALGEDKKDAKHHFYQKMREYHAKAAYEHAKKAINDRRDKRLEADRFDATTGNDSKGEWMRPDMDLLVF